LSRARLPVRLLAVGSLWVAALAGNGGIAATTLAALATLVVPGWAIERGLRLDDASEISLLERLARWLTYSVALIGLLGLVTSAGGGRVTWVLVSLLGASVAGCFAPTAPAINPTGSRRDSPAWPGRLLVLVTLAVTVIAAGRASVARDRSWYLAYITQLAAGSSLEWTEPFFGTDHVVARFAYNAWLVALAAVSALARAPATVAFEGVVPVLLVPCVAGAATAFARTVLGPGIPAAVGALASLAVLSCTRYPFFSPERYPFFGRLAEDKTVALLVLAPVALAAAIDFLPTERPRAWRAALAVVLAGFAVGSTHALVCLLLLIAVVAGLGWQVLIARTLALSRAAVLLLAFVPSLPLPTLIGLSARSQMAAIDQATGRADATNPVVRSHLRVGRVAGLGSAVSPVAARSLLADPLLAMALAGLIPAAHAWRSTIAAWLVPGSVVFLTLAFVPAFASALGTVVLPWMTYRALWGIPFGLLLGMLALSISNRIGRMLAVAVACGLAALVLAAQPWSAGISGGAADARRRGEPDPETRELLKAIAALPRDSTIAAASALAEWIPGTAGRSVLAFADRGTVVFAGSRMAAEARMQANAALVGANGRSRRFRNRIAAAFGVTHTVYAEEACDRGTSEVYRNEQYVLCAEREPRSQGQPLSYRPSAQLVPAGESVLASLGSGFSCEPSGTREGQGGTYHWQRRSRWTGFPLHVDCSASFPSPVDAGSLAIALQLPRAEEAVLYWLETRGTDGGRRRRRGTLEFSGNDERGLSLNANDIVELRLRLVPAYLPYLNLRSLKLRGR
jgi:hypothetical protein